MPARPASAPPTTRVESGFSFRAAAERPRASPASAGALSEAQVDLAWRVLTGGAGEHTQVNAKSLLHALQQFQPSATAEDAALLLGGEAFLTKESLCTLLLGNASLFLLFDPVREVVEGGALGQPGEMSYAALRRQMEGLRCGPGALSDAAWQTLLVESDADRDGRLALEDVRGLLSRHGR